MNATERTLYSAFDLGGIQLKNRLALAPMTRARSDEQRLANPLMAEYYAQRAGAGLLISEATVVSSQGIGWSNTPGIFTDEQGRSWNQVAEAVHARGGRIFLQLWHCGRASHSSFHNGELPVAPSAVRLAGDELHTPEGKKEHETPRALETDELPGIVETYTDAAHRAIASGLDGVEIHSANGYLLDQFLQSRTNRRDDAYGGSIENRFRLLREIVESICGVIPASKVAVRLAPNGVFNDMGSPDFRETFSYAAGQLDAYGLAYLHVMDGLAFGFHEQGQPMTLENFREWFHGPLMGNCGYDRESAEAAVARGAADLIAIGRPYIGNPDLAERFRNGWPLAPLPDMAGWYGGSPAGEGYTEYPAYSDEEKS